MYVKLAVMLLVKLFIVGQPAGQKKCKWQGAPRYSYSATRSGSLSASKLTLFTLNAIRCVVLRCGGASGVNRPQQ